PCSWNSPVRFPRSNGCSAIRTWPPHRPTSGLRAAASKRPPWPTPLAGCWVGVDPILSVRGHRRRGRPVAGGWTGAALERPVRGHRLEGGHGRRLVLGSGGRVEGRWFGHGRI